ncbi:MAG: hypothetical protein RLZZ524_1449 [Pseudomonadota bacterium]|jgi:hypothetical protein
MPCFGGYDYGRSRNAHRHLAHQQVLAKFPGIIVGSSGYARAIANRMRRMGAA